MAEAAALRPEDRAPTTSHHVIPSWQRRRKMWQRLLAVKFHEPTEDLERVPDSPEVVQP